MGASDSAPPAATPATATDARASLRSKANPLVAMTKQEEFMAMQKPGQAGDDSSEALHPPKYYCERCE